MFKIAIIAFLILGVMISTSCKDEFMIQAKDYPYFRIDSAQDINYFGAKFTVNFLKAGKEPCMEYGLVWKIGAHSIPFANDSMLSIIGNPVSSVVNFDITGRTVSNTEYTIRAYARTQNDEYVYSRMVTFKTPPYPQPVIDGYNKDTVLAGSQVAVIGHNFKPNSKMNLLLLYEIVNMSNRVFQVRIDSSSDTRVVIYVPTTLESGKARIDMKGDMGWVYPNVYFYIKGN